MTALPPTGEGPGSSDDTSKSTASDPTTTTSEAEPFAPNVEEEDRVSMPMNMDTSSSSFTSGETWARGIFDKRREEAGVKGGKRQASLGASAATAAKVSSTPPPPPASAANTSVTKYPASGFVGALSGGAGPGPQYPGATGLGAGSGIGRRAESSVTSSHGRSSSTTGLGPLNVGAGSSAAPPPPASPASAAPPPATGSVGQDMSRIYQEGGSAPLSLFSPVPFASSPSAELNNAPPGEEQTEGLELLDASELEEANAAGVLDAVDALLGEAALEGFGEEAHLE